MVDSYTQGQSVSQQSDESKFKGDARGNYFIQKVASAWNMLLVVVIEADGIVAFESLLDRQRRKAGNGGIWVYVQADGLSSLFGSDIVGPRA